MGNGHNGGSSRDVDFFDTQRNDIPTGPSRLHQEAYVDYQCPQDRQQTRHSGRDGYVTIRDGANIIYAEAGSTVIINQGEGRIGRGQGSWVPQDYSDTMREVADSRRAQYVLENRGQMPRRYYDEDCPTQYRPVSSGDYEPERYVSRHHRGNGDGVGRFFGALLGGVAEGVGIGIGTRVFGGHGGFGRGNGFVPGFITGSVLNGGDRSWGSYDDGSDYAYYMQQQRMARYNRQYYTGSYQPRWENRGWG